MISVLFCILIWYSKSLTITDFPPQNNIIQASLKITEFVVSEATPNILRNFSKMKG